MIDNDIRVIAELMRCMIIIIFFSFIVLAGNLSWKFGQDLARKEEQRARCIIDLINEDIDYGKANQICSTANNLNPERFKGNRR